MAEISVTTDNNSLTCNHENVNNEDHKYMSEVNCDRVLENDQILKPIIGSVLTKIKANRVYDEFICVSYDEFIKELSKRLKVSYSSSAKFWDDIRISILLILTQEFGVMLYESSHLLIYLEIKIYYISLIY